MFTGLITNIGEVLKSEVLANSLKILVASSYQEIEIGESISCNGVCLTVTAVSGGNFETTLSSETIARTGEKYWQLGAKLNLERALQVGQRLGGHFVTGHVDCLAKLISIVKDGDCHELTLRAPIEMAKLIAVKGSVALNGVSLTVNSVDDANFKVMIIPHTWENTTFHEIESGAEIHLEVDLIARYTARLMEYL